MTEAPDPAPLADQPTDLDLALRALITNLKPFNLTKAEVLTIVNLGVGLDTTAQDEPAAVAAGDEDTVMQDGEVNGEVAAGDGAGENSAEAEAEAEAGEGEEMVEGEGEDADYGALALLDTVIEDREERLSNEDVGEILRIVRETLGKK